MNAGRIGLAFAAALAGCASSAESPSALPTLPELQALSGPALVNRLFGSLGGQVAGQEILDAHIAGNDGVRIFLRPQAVGRFSGLCQSVTLVVRHRFAPGPTPAGQQPETDPAEVPITIESVESFITYPVLAKPGLLNPDAFSHWAPRDPSIPGDDIDAATDAQCRTLSASRWGLPNAVQAENPIQVWAAVNGLAFLQKQISEGGLRVPLKCVGMDGDCAAIIGGFRTSETLVLPPGGAANTIPWKEYMGVETCASGERDCVEVSFVGRFADPLLPPLTESNRLERAGLALEAIGTLTLAIYYSTDYQKPFRVKRVSALRVYMTPLDGRGRPPVFPDPSLK